MILHSIHRRRARLAGACCTALAAMTITATGTTTARAGATANSPAGPLVRITSGMVRGADVPGGFAFRGLPYAAPPTGNLRWRPPHLPASWRGVRDATRFEPSCPQAASAFSPPAPFSEDCLYLNVSTPTLRHGASRPVLVWIHGGGFTQDAGRNYDPVKLAADGVVVVTVNYRLGALGFLAHPALASRPGGPAGNYGLMDQQAALRWVQANISRFGGNPRDVTIDGESAGGLSVLAHLVSAGSRGLFQRAIVQSGAFALHQQALPAAEAAGKAFAAKAGCPDQTAQCLRHLPVADLVKNFPGAAIPGVVDGQVLTESVGSALAAGRFARVPILDGTNHDEEAIFVEGAGVTVSGGTFVPLPQPVTAGSYRHDIAAVLGVPASRAATIAARYPLTAYPAPAAAFSALAGDANFACPALQLDRWTAKRVPTFAYELNDNAAPQRFVPPGKIAPVATHGSELQYLFDLPNAPVPGTFSAGQQKLAASMRTAWAHFAATGNPATAAVPWPALTGGSNPPVLSLVPPRPQVETDFSAEHHCAFWGVG